MPSVLFYISGHGYGHVRRTSEVIHALRRRRPDTRIIIRTHAAPAIFDESLRSFVQPAEIDFPVVEDGALRINAAATLATARALLDRRNTLVEAEVAKARELQTSLIVADIPFLAGDVAESLGVQCVGVSNFSWDWILEPLAGRDHALIEEIGSSYAKMTTLLQLPFGGVSSAFRDVRRMPLIARRPSKQSIPLDRGDGRPRVLVGLRGGVPAETLRAAARAAPDFFILHVDPSAADAQAENLRYVPLTPARPFADVLAASDIVVSKLGYGIVADSIAIDVRLVWPRREGFREDEVMTAEAPRHLRMTEIPIERFDGGEWAESLRAVMKLPSVEPTETNGADVCAEFLKDFIR